MCNDMLFVCTLSLCVEAQSTDYSVNPPHQSARCSTVSTFVGGDRSGLSTQAPPTHLPLPAIIGVSHSKSKYTFLHVLIAILWVKHYSPHTKIFVDQAQ